MKLKNVFLIELFDIIKTVSEKKTKNCFCLSLFKVKKKEGEIFWIKAGKEIDGVHADRGAWWATVRGVAKSQTQFSD